MNRLETSLATILKTKIRSEGPITFRDYMALALYEERHGFYSQGPDIGSPNGPFDTNAKYPAFGYAIAQAITDAENKIGCQLRILELGGGTGQLGKSIVSFLSLPHEYLIFDPSPGLRASQEQLGLTSISNLNHLPPHPTFVFGNEVLDALPVHRVMGMGNDDMVELYVDLDQDGEFTEHPGPLSTGALAERFSNEGIRLGRGQVAEVCLDLKSFFNNFRQVIDIGYVIFIDYGHPASDLYSYQHRNGTLRCYFKQQQIHDPFFAVGLQDLTADVDFSAVLSIAQETGFEVAAPISQETWLRNLGLGYEKRPQGTKTDQLDIERLMSASGLGSTFDVMIFKTMGLPDGPGLQPSHE